MRQQMLHIFRNTPFGRETLLESCYFAKTLGLELVVYIPRTARFLMYFDNDVVQIDLDKSYLTAPETAEEHAREILGWFDLEPVFFTPRHFTSPELPDIPTHFAYMCCPRVIADLSSKIGLGYIGPRVRKIVRNATFPVYIPNPVYKQWKSLAVFFGGSANALKALRVGLSMSATSGMPLKVFTQLEGKPKEHYEQIVREAGLEDALKDWVVFEGGKLEVNLYEVPHDALVIVGAYGHGLIKELAFGSTMERIQHVLPNSMVIVGPYVEP